MWRQTAAGIIALAPYFFEGVNQGFSSNLQHQQEANSLSFHIDDSDLSWIASAPVMFTPIGSLFSGYLMEIFGRKIIILSSSVLTILGWICISLAESVLVMSAGRCLTGMAVGMQIASTMYIAEITESPKQRAVLLSWMNPLAGVGLIASYTFGSILSERCFTLVVCATTFVVLALTFVIPESPVFLMVKNDEAGAAKMLDWLQRDHRDMEQYAREIRNKELELDMEHASLAAKIMATKAWKPYLNLVAVFALHQLAGYSMLVCYASQFYSLLRVPLHGASSAIVQALLQLFAWTFLSCTIDRLNRRTWMLISAGGLFMCYAVAAVYVYSCDGSSETRPIFWLPWICLQLSIVFHCLGLSSLPWVMLGEVFPTSVKDFMGSITLMTTFFIEFLVTKSYPLLIPYVTLVGALILFSGASFLAVLYALFWMPETRGKTLLEIEKYWLS